jgi:ATP-dependent Clp protease adaptor protein ClpS
MPFEHSEPINYSKESGDTMSYKVHIRPDGEVRPQEPNLYAVIMHNDDYTTMDFFVSVLVKIFYKTPAEAHAIMMSVHQKGKCSVGIFPYDIAITKSMQAEKYAEENDFPLHITVEIQ